MKGLAVHAGADRLSSRRVLHLAAFACIAATGSLDVTDTQADSLILELVVPTRVRVGNRVPITLRVVNRAGRRFDLYLRGRTATFDVVVTGPDSTVVWRRLDGEIIPAIVHLRTLAPAERMELEAVWDQRTRAGGRLPGGAYEIRGFLLVEGKALKTRPVPLQIDPG